MRFAPCFPLSLITVSLLSHAATAQEKNEIETNEIERIETTSSRIQGSMNASGYAVSSISEETLSLLSFQHIQESLNYICLLYTSPSPRDSCASRMPSSA